MGSIEPSSSSNLFYTKEISLWDTITNTNMNMNTAMSIPTPMTGKPTAMSTPTPIRMPMATITAMIRMRTATNIQETMATMITLIRIMTKPTTAIPTIDRKHNRDGGSRTHYCP